MRVRLLDKVETSHMMVEEFETGSIAAQEGLTILSEVHSTAHGLKACNYVILCQKDAIVELPDRLAARLFKIYLATPA